MKDIIPAKKESPILGLSGMGGGVGSNLGGSLEKTLYLEDVFSTYLYKGTGTESGSTGQTITNGIDLSGDGGLTWIKSRSNGTRHALVDTVRGAGKMLSSGEYVPQSAADLTGLASFTSDGFTLGNESGGYQRCNMQNEKYASWSFRKSKGFFDIVSYTGNGANRTISHGLGCIPGMIIIKSLTSNQSWAVYHRETGATQYLVLNGDTTPATVNATFWQNTEPTENVFSLGTNAQVNGNEEDYIAYVFGGGKSTAATARSVTFDGSGDYVQYQAASSGIAVGTGNFTYEFFIKLRGNPSGNDAFIDTRSAAGVADGFQLYIDSNRTLTGYVTGDMFGGNTAELPINVWQHIAVVRTTSGEVKLYLNGRKVGTTYTGTQNFSNSEMIIGANLSGTTETICAISNLRLNKGEGLYASSFRPPTEPLTTTSQGSTASNVKILACNNASVTGGTVVPATVNTGGDPTASTDNPFDDPGCFNFGEEKDQNLVKCGRYLGKGATRVDINLGWEPQWVMIKSQTLASGHTNWAIYDNMRGVLTKGGTNAGYDKQLCANLSDTEDSGDNYANGDMIEFTSTGFAVGMSNGWDVNAGSNQNYIFMAIRRQDPLVTKLVESGTDVYTQVYGTSNNDLPAFNSGFVTDFTLFKNPTSSGSWYSQERLTGTGYLVPSANSAEVQSANNTWDFMDGYYSATGDWSSSMNWMWKRHAGFDVVNYMANGVASTAYNHNLGRVPEMMWFKQRSGTGDWRIYHKGLNSGNNAWQWMLELNSNDAENGGNIWWYKTPTSTHFTVNTSAHVNTNGDYYQAMLFASVDGISKVGSYAGTGSSLTITTGFQPRFLWIKRVDAGGYSFYIFDITRGWVAGNDAAVKLNSNDAQATGTDFGEPTSTGFTVSTNVNVGASGGRYVYYAHA